MSNVVAKCTKCGIEKELNGFPKVGGKGGLSSWCRACHSARNKALKAQLEKSNLEFYETDPIGLLENELKKINLEIDKKKIIKEKISTLSNLYLKYQVINKELKNDFQ